MSLLRLFLLVLGFLLASTSLPACSVPVFRYALEKWVADNYEAIVFHRGPLTTEHQALARDLGNDGQAGKTHANISVRCVDLAQNPAAEELALWQKSGGGNLPWLLVRYPQETRLPGHLFSGPLAESGVRALLNSPVREQLARRLTSGESAVWVLLESGDRARDDAAAKLVETRLNYLTTVLKLPALDPQDIAAGLVSVPAGGLKLAFSVLRVSRADAAEAAFVPMLLGTEPDLADLKEPLLFPVFGRGRVLYALAGAGINHETLDEVASFLIGKCSCQVKDLNPGVDLLLAADWDGQLRALRALPTAVTPTTAGPPETVAIIGGAATPASEAKMGGDTFWLAVACALAGLAALAAYWLRRP